MANPEPENRVMRLSPQMVGLRFQASARSAGVEARVPAHSAHVRLASELTARCADERRDACRELEDISVAQYL